MSVLELYGQFRSDFPGLTEKADREHVRRWDEIDPAFAYSWFESLASAVNREMISGIRAIQYQNEFSFLRSAYLHGDKDVRNCIDVSFVENLFWGVTPERSLDYWAELPEVLRDLYVGFHGRKPTDGGNTNDTRENT